MEKTVFELKASFYCNINCNFCVFSDRKGKNKPLTKEYIIRVVNIIRKKYHNIDCFIVSGGEPLIREDVWKILKAVIQYLEPKKLVLHTNGLIFPDKSELNNFVQGNGVVFLSFHTLSEKTYLKFTNTNLLPQLKHNLESFIDNKVPVYSNTVIMEPNQYEIEKIGDFLFKKGVRKMEFRFPFGIKSRLDSFPWIIPNDFLAIAIQLKYLNKKHPSLNIFLHPSVTCLIVEKLGLRNDDLIQSLLKISKKSIKRDEYCSGKNINYLYLDRKLHLIKERFQQKAVNRGKNIFRRIPKCKNCQFENYCLGLPEEFF